MASLEAEERNELHRVGKQMRVHPRENQNGEKHGQLDVVGAPRANRNPPNERTVQRTERDERRKQTRDIQSTFSSHVHKRGKD